MNKLISFLMLVPLIIGVLLSGCFENEQKDVSPSTGEGTMSLYVSDSPADIGDFDLLNVSFYKVRIFKEENETDSKWTERSINETVDLTTLIGPNSTRIVNITLTAGNYSKIELYVNHTLGIVNGNETAVFVPSGKLMMTRNFTLSANDTIRYVFDINVIKRGIQDEYNLLPVISKSGVVGQHLGEDEFEEV